MNIIIVGCGKIGSTILSGLLEEGHAITVIDTDPNVVSDLSNIYDCMYVCGSGADCDTLEEAGVENTEMFVAVTGSDELNMISCFMAKRMGAKHTIARIRNPEYNDRSLIFMRQQLDLSMVVNPDLLAAQEIYHILQLPSAIKVEYFSRRNFEMIELRMREDSPLCGIPLRELRKKYAHNFLIGVVQRGERIYIPDGNFELQIGDRIELVAIPGEASKMLRQMGILKKQARNVMIMGASLMAFYLTKRLLASGTGVTLLERKHDRCHEFSEKLPGATVICADGSRQEVLLEEGVRSMDAFVSLTGMDEENILTSFFASTQGVPKVISKVNRDELIPIAETLGVDSRISGRQAVSSLLTRYARALQNSLGSNVETLYKVMDGRAEALEFRVTPDFPAIDKPIMEIRFKPGILVAGIIRGRKPFIPGGSDVIRSGDHVIILATDHQLRDLADVLQ